MAGAEITLGLDFGDKTVGVAVTDGLFLTAQGLETIHRERWNKRRKTLARIEEICKSREVKRIVLGYPLGLDGVEGERCERTKEFKDALEKRLDLPVELVDERFTTNMANRLMTEGGVRSQELKSHADMVSAVLILESWMEQQKRD